MAISRIRCVWSGDAVTGPGLSTFFYEGAGTGRATAVKNFMTGIAAVLPSEVTITVPSDGDVLDEATGQLVGSWSSPGEGGIVVGTKSGTRAQGVGLRIAWQTGVIRGGHRVRGSTFIVPVWSSAFDTDGSITSATLSSVQASADALVGALDGFCIWSRPRPGLVGAAAPVSSALVPDRVSWLRSRRT